MDVASFVLDPSFRRLVAATATGFMLLEYGVGRLSGHTSHDWARERCIFGRRAGPEPPACRRSRAARGSVRVSLRTPAVDFPQTSLLALAGLFFGSEFLYYWQHRASHRTRWMWATHSVHHSTTRFKPDGRDPARLDRKYLRQLPVLPAARLRRLSSLRHRHDARRQPAVSVLHPHRACAEAGPARMGAQTHRRIIACTTPPMRRASTRTMVAS